MTKRMNRLRKILYLLSLSLAAALIILTFAKGSQYVLLVVVAVFLLLALFVLLDISYQAYTDRLLISLSDLVESIIDLKSIPLFSETEDTLLSKLQSQVIKLSGILNSQNTIMKEEQENIKTLISDISHQIKTPVASIKMFAELLKESDLNEEQRAEYITILVSSLEKLTFLTDSLIKMSRLESGIIQLRPVKAQVDEIILKAIKQVYPKARKKSIELIYEPVEEIFITADINWTTEAVFNILDNAVKYTKDTGKVTIKILPYESFVRIDVSDTGYGISEADLAKIWSRFYRGSQAENEEGVGIGLYLTREIVLKQGGYVKASSSEEGSLFSVFLAR